MNIIIKCPYCLEEHRILPINCGQSNQDIIFLCNKCKKNFKFSYSVTFEAGRIKKDCILNGEKHEMEDNDYTNQIEQMFTYQKCKNCSVRTRMKKIGEIK